MKAESKLVRNAFKMALALILMTAISPSANASCDRAYHNLVQYYQGSSIAKEMGIGGSAAGVAALPFAAPFLVGTLALPALIEGGAIIIGGAGGAIVGIENKLNYNNYFATYQLLQEARKASGPNLELLAAANGKSMAQASEAINQMNDANQFCMSNPLRYKTVVNMLKVMLQ